MLKHEDIVLLQKNPNSKVPHECLFNALSFKLGGTPANNLMMEESLTFKGPRRHYTMDYLMRIGHETQQTHLPQQPNYNQVQKVNESNLKPLE